MPRTNTSIDARATKHDRSKPPAPPNPEVMTLMEFCGWARVCRSVAFQEIAAGRLRAVRIGRRSLITIQAARDWLEMLQTKAA
jgi:hypothetical protein